MQPAVSVIVVTHGSAEVAKRAVEAVLQSSYDGFLEVLVADNTPGDGVIRVLEAAFPAASGPGVGRLTDNRALRLRQVENRGLGAAINTALAKARGDLVLQLNPDCLLEASALDHLTRSTFAPGELRSPLLRKSDGGIQMGGSQHRRFVGRDKPLRDIASITRASGSPHLVPSGACLLARRADLVKAGGFDEALFLYYEEASILARYRLAGLEPKVVIVTEAIAVHDGGVTTGSQARVSALTRHHVSRSAILYARRYDPITVPTVASVRLLTAMNDWARGRHAEARAGIRGLVEGFSTFKH